MKYGDKVLARIRGFWRPAVFVCDERGGRCRVRWQTKHGGHFVPRLATVGFEQIQKLDGEPVLDSGAKEVRSEDDLEAD